MRKFFASAFGLSATLALVAGLVFAWTGTASQQAGTPSVIGSLNVAVSIDGYTGTVLLPGVNTKTASGKVANNTGVPIALTGGSISGINVPANTGCNTYLTGSIVITNGAAVPTATIGGGWDSYLNLSSTTHNACQGLGVDYVINLDVTT
jgi:hypothetical protein